MPPALALHTLADAHLICKCCDVNLNSSVFHDYCVHCVARMDREDVIEELIDSSIIQKLEDQIRRLKAALKPFADFANRLTPNWPNTTGLNLLYFGKDHKLLPDQNPNLGDCRRAAEAYDS